MTKKILCYWTTATPIPFQWFNINMENCEPNLNGEISKNGFEILTLIGQLKYEHINITPATPFILRGVAENTNYSEKERLKLESIKAELKIVAFEKFPIDETKGDRYLMIGYAPSINILNKRLK